MVCSPWARPAPLISVSLLVTPGASLWLSRGSALLRPLVKVLRLGLGCLSSVSVLRLGLGLVTGGWPRL